MNKRNVVSSSIDDGNLMVMSYKLRDAIFGRLFIMKHINDVLGIVEDTMYSSYSPFAFEQIVLSFGELHGDREALEDLLEACIGRFKKRVRNKFIYGITTDLVDEKTLGKLESVFRDADMWFKQNREEVLDAMDRFSGNVKEALGPYSDAEYSVTRVLPDEFETKVLVTLMNTSGATNRTAAVSRKESLDVLHV